MTKILTFNDLTTPQPSPILVKTLTVVSVVICVSEATWPFGKKLLVGIERTNFSRQHCRSRLIQNIVVERTRNHFIVY